MEVNRARAQMDLATAVVSRRPPAKFDRQATGDLRSNEWTYTNHGVATPIPPKFGRCDLVADHKALLSAQP
jgi:hypothetical protein